MRAILLAAAIVSMAFPVSAQDKGAGKSTYDKTCALCHATGLAGAPKFGNKADWAPRLKAGAAKLYTSALKGTANGMPGKGGNLTLSDGDVKAAVDYLVASVGGAKSAAAPVAAAAAKPSPRGGAESRFRRARGRGGAARRAACRRRCARRGGNNGSGGPQRVQPAARGARKAQRAAGRRRHPRSREPGHARIAAAAHRARRHAGARGGQPRELGVVPRGGRITPRWDRDDAGAAAVVMDLNIVREVKGSMPDVVYPHKQHTEWLDCSNCHPQIFIPQKGANQISMASIMLGQKCGVCHGKVAFPVSECRLCHSKKKEGAGPAAAVAGARK